MGTLIGYILVAAALHYLLYWAEVTSWLTSRYPPWMARWAGCPACSGFWYGIACGGVGWWLRLPLLGLEPRHPITVLAAGAITMMTTPMVMALQLYALSHIEGIKQAVANAGETGTTDNPVNAPSIDTAAAAGDGGKVEPSHAPTLAFVALAGALGFFVGAVLGSVLDKDTRP
jgi:hypothetical protein